MSRDRYTAAEREHAAQLCSMCACDRAAGGYTGIYDAGRSTQAPAKICALACGAWIEAERTFHLLGNALVYAEAEALGKGLIYAEAEALLRTGWAPEWTPWTP
jgi:hypothetical protein